MPVVASKGATRPPNWGRCISLPATTWRSQCLRTNLDRWTHKAYLVEEGVYPYQPLPGEVGVSEQS